MPSELNPISQVYNALWDLTDVPLVNSQVKIGNKIRFNDPSWISKAKPEVSQGDLPELALVVSQLGANPRANSSSSQLIVTFDWLLSTGDPSVNRGVLPIMWGIFCALCDWPSKAQELTTRGNTFIKNLRFNSAAIGLNDAEKNRGIAGFSAIWSVEVEIWVSTADAIEASQEPI